jgi:hypothetical protein
VITDHFDVLVGSLVGGTATALTLGFGWLGAAAGAARFGNGR